jgi:purine-binding chemotaxis protein CheW
MPSENASVKSYVFCELAGTTYAVDSHSVQQIELVEHVTPVPNAPSFLDGVVFARGQVVPVVNLRARFGFPRAAHDDKTRLMVVSQAGRTVGLLVDSAREFVTLPGEAVKPPPEAVTGLSGKYLSGIATVGDRVILILDVNEVLCYQDLLSTTGTGIS